MAIQFLENESLAKYTTFKIGGEAKYFFAIKNSSDWHLFLDYIKANPQMPYLILGGGSNVLISDDGFDGLVVKIDEDVISVKTNIIAASAGVPITTLAYKACQAGLTGLEWAAGLPGTVGGAIRGNAGSFGHTISESVSLLEVAKPDVGTIRYLSADQMGFGYRTSILKENNWLVTNIIFKFESDDPQDCLARFKEIMEKKQALQPLNYPSAGCVFKNPKTSDLSVCSPIPVEFLDKDTIPAGFLIEQCNLKNHIIGQAMISPKHADFIVNLGGATAQDVLQLMKLARQRVKEKFGVSLQEEIQLVNLQF